MLTLEPITSGIHDGRHQHYPTPDLAARTAETETSAEETACRMLLQFQPVSYLRLVDAAGTVLREYRRCDFFLRKSPLRVVHQRVALELIDERIAGQKEIGKRVAMSA
ncbi:hypothetical protein [Streptomyces sp. SID161]|uniref:hypothetical protein n=1 Tax=Streptomyces sp. SID161 TaxID=2690251 RepID=UPI00136CDA00|nr:hypothetical protein [Streptomyces sp. SID161]MYW46378.1 hypothetical protein [Streptomyces sp. SID161]